MVLYVFRQTLREFLRSRRLLPWIFLSVLTFVLAANWRELSPTSGVLERYTSVMSVFVYRLLALASAIYTTAIVSQEVEQKTISYLLTRPIERWRLLLGRYLASVVVVGGVCMVTAFLVSSAVFAGSQVNHAGLLERDLAALGVGALAYGALFLFVSLLFNRAMLICLLFAFGWETSMPNLPGELYRVTIFSYLQGIASHPPLQAQDKLLAFVMGAIGPKTVSLAACWITMGILIVSLLAASCWWFTHFEYIAREDAE
ncbi:MAG: ABC transporter permease [Fimbriimonas ginsengisoli]|uniref:ABC transporter permease n=1 Tax=Fimbriimonas ginsengisoli TaxID=1005039 RepID=A0A931PVN3_FIMGI|nr:ABC transporter permease [Fimbriimonas ginsengisoli]MBI3722134.1 ABC transporter permease [Fimbriimonas ginsengisoli]